jgi:hypothetical protein
MVSSQGRQSGRFPQAAGSEEDREEESEISVSLSSFSLFSSLLLYQERIGREKKKMPRKTKKRLPAHLVQGGGESPRDDVDRRPPDRVGFGPPQPVRRRTATPRTITEKDPGI